MGVPALFRWLSQKYPKIISQVVEEQQVEINGEKIPMDTRGPNPNGEEFDNLYLDMNGIVHPCSHPEDRPAPETEEEMMLAIFEYTERVVRMVRPRKLLMIAVDGVAPRAKMNQQRSRRFRSAQEAKEKDEDKAEFLKMLKSKKGGVDTEIHEAIVKKTWDSNAITPGTPFMHLLAESLRYWCAYKLNEDPAWERMKVIISDASVPGEGEHKIMNFVRSQRRSPEHDPNTRHVIYGLDADLIMLGLATHEPHFRVLREDVFFESGKVKTCPMCGQAGHIAQECTGEAKKKQGEFDEKQNEPPLKPFIWLHVSILREYLEAELYIPDQPFRFDLERALDDWVFMCFFVGNDFLPHLPSLDIREQGIDTLIAIWKDNIPIMGGYVTKDGHVDLERAQYILSGLAKQEDAIFRRRHQNDERQRANAKRRRLEKERRESRNSDGHNGATHSDPGTPMHSYKRVKEDTSTYANVPFFDPKDAQSNEVRQITHDMFVNRKALFQANQANKSAAAALKSQLLGQKSSGAEDTPQVTEGNAEGENYGDAATATPGDNSTEPPSVLGKRKAELIEDSDTGTPGRSTPNRGGTPKEDPDAPPPDTVRLWEEGYADRYYEQKFKVSPYDLEFRHQVGKAYVEGLCWVLLYYMQGCPSWIWYYPYHYAPFAADFVDMGNMKIEFRKGKPFKPYEQLMGVLPAASNHAIPEAFRGLMSDPDSDILDFYPEDFELDLNGKKFAWQGVALLPFIDEKRLLDAMNRKYPLLTPEEHARNETGKDVLMFSTNHPLYEEVAAAFYSKKAAETTHKLNPKNSGGLSGKVEKNDSYIPQSKLSFPLDSKKMPDIEDDQSISVNYEMPLATHTHKSMLLRGVTMPTKALDSGDIAATRSRANRSGRSYGGVPLNDDRNGGHQGRGGRNGGGYNGGGGNPINYANPFAAHLNPNFVPGAGRGLPPPPHVAAAGGWMPPPPGQFGRGGPPPPTNGGGYGYGGGYGGGGYGGNSQGGYQGGQGVDSYNGGGRRHDERGGYQDRNGGYGGGRGGRGGYSGRGGRGGYDRH